MRDPSRLDTFYENLRKLHKEFFPDWRFGQLAHNLLTWVQTTKKIDPFFVEEDRMVEYINEFVDAMCRGKTKL